MNANVIVTVMDGSKKVIPGAKVRIQQAGSRVHFEGTTDSAGQVVFADIKAHQYRLTADKGSRRSAIRVLQVYEGANITVLHVAGLRESRYYCDYCDKGWNGVTNRRATKPLNQAANEAANKEVWEQCAERLETKPKTRKGRRLNLSRDDYLCRRRWMDAYLAYEETEDKEDPPPDNPPSCVINCPKEKPPKKDIYACMVQTVEATCAHGRKAVYRSPSFYMHRLYGSVQQLQIVPDERWAHEIVHLHAVVHKSCGSHPVWSLDGAKKNKVTSDFSLEARAPIVAHLWTPRTSPKVYTVECWDHYSATKIVIEAFPSVEFKVDVNLDKFKDIYDKIKKVVEIAAEVAADKFKWEFGLVKVIANGQWKEHTDHRAYYGYAIAANGTFIKGTFAITIGPSKITKWIKKIPKLGKYIAKVINYIIKAGLEIEIDGSMGCNVDIKRGSPDEREWVEDTGGGISGDIGVTVKLGARAVGSRDNPLIGVELSGQSAFVSRGTGFVAKDGFGADFSVDFDGLTGALTVKAIWGLIAVNESIKMIDKKNIWGGKKGKRLYFSQDSK